jgi:hypothetical protein
MGIDISTEKARLFNEADRPSTTNEDVKMLASMPVTSIPSYCSSFP